MLSPRCRSCEPERWGAPRRTIAADSITREAFDDEALSRISDLERQRGRCRKRHAFTSHVQIIVSCACDLYRSSLAIAAAALSKRVAG